VAFANSEYRGLAVAYLQSTVGDQFAAVAVALLVYDRTGSPGWTAAAYALTMLPSLIAGPALSWVADRYPRRNVMITCGWMQAAILATMAAPGMPLGATVILLIVVQLIQTPYNAAQSASLPVLLSPRAYPVGQAFFDSAFSVGQLVGLAAAGFVVTSIGSQMTLAVDAATCVMSSILISRTMRPRWSPLSGIRRDGDRVKARLLHILREDPKVLPLIGLLWMVSFAIVPEGLAVPLASEIHAPWAIGLILAMDPGANLLGLYVLGRYMSFETRLRWVGVLCLMTVLPLPIFFLPLGLAPVLIVLLVIGLAGAYHTTAKAALYSSIPDHWRGRVSGFVRIGLRAGQGIGIAVGGLVASATGSSRTAIALSGCAGLALCVLPALRLRTLHRRTTHP
jgi:MFS family permease